VSSLVFPELVGLGWDVLRTPQWSTNVQSALSGKTSTVGKRLYPLIRWEVAFNLLREVGAAGYSSSTSELLQIVGLFNAVQGRFDTFLRSDPDFNSVTGQLFGTVATGINNYQLVATYQNPSGPGYDELIQNLNAVPVLAAGSSFGSSSVISSGNYTIGGAASGFVPGLVNFTTLPTVGLNLYWTGTFYYRCRFDEDELKGLRKFMNKLWLIDKLAFTSVKL
jgi:hypothetical protein